MTCKFALEESHTLNKDKEKTTMMLISFERIYRNRTVASLEI
jgi:hypothetical protein